MGMNNTDRFEEINLMNNFVKFLLTILIIFIHIGTVAASEEASRQSEDPGAEVNGALPGLEEDDAQLSSAQKIHVSKFRLEGNTIFTDEELLQAIASYKNREISPEELFEAKDTITRYYVNRGYINSGAIIPEQGVKNGVITMRIIEGKLSHTEVSGATRLRTGYITSRLKPATGYNGRKPLNVNKLQEGLKLLKQDPRIKGVDVKVTPGLELGEAALKVEVTEARPYHATLKFNNHGPPGTGSYRGEIDLEHLNITGWGDALRVHGALSEGTDDYGVNYTIPISGRDTTLSLGVEHKESTVISDPFDVLDIESKTTTAFASLRHPFFKTPSQEFAVGLKLEKRRNRTYLSGDPFSFVQTDEPGKSDDTVVRFFQEWIKSSLTQVFAVRSSVNFGIDMWDATVLHDDSPDGRFITWLGQLQWLRRIKPLNSMFLLSINSQLSNDPLLAMEKFAIGGSSSVRGYRENQLTTDYGVTFSLEWRIPVVKLKMPLVSKKANDGQVHICPFIDWGNGWNKDGPDPRPNGIYSAGIGARWSASERLQAEIYWGEALKDVYEPEDDDIQDDGVHFQVSLVY